MTLTIEDGAGIETADSYVTVEQADEYVEHWYADDDWKWTGLEERDKARALRQGARYVDSFRFQGAPRQPFQALAFPRVGIPAPGNHAAVSPPVYPADAIPERVRRAQIEAALRHAEGENLMPDHHGGRISSESRQAGPVQKQTDYSVGRREVKTREAIRALLRPFLQHDGELSRVLG